MVTLPHLVFCLAADLTRDGTSRAVLLEGPTARITHIAQRHRGQVNPDE
ncbi:hypothetical protein MOQ72_41190 [Saccharopolyspora sp. K220]|nr:hypothetical protein [Saccharopolyspora soli]